MASPKSENTIAAIAPESKSDKAHQPFGFQNFARRLRFLDYAAYVIIFLAVLAAITRHS